MNEWQRPGPGFLQKTFMAEQHINGSVAPPPTTDASVPGGRGQDINGSDLTAGGGGTAGLSLTKR